jgi:choice-of-anchor B domain-containing protein
MNDHRNRLTLSGFLPMLLLTIAAFGLATPATADRNDPFGELAKDLNLKRSKNTGKGMPSIRGPFPDTDGLLFLGQLTNADLGVSRLIFTGASFLSDIWGWTDTPDPENLDYTEDYVIVGTSSGVAFVRVTDPTAPEFLGLVPTTNPDTLRNFWWDIKTYNNHAYWTTEVNNAGVGIFDLTRLRDLDASPPETRLQANDYYYGDKGDYIRAHNISINEETGFAYLTGVSKDDPGFTDDGLVILDLSDPLAPQEVGQILDIDSHDAQIVTYHGLDDRYTGREIAFVFNGGDLEVGIYDVTDIGPDDKKVISPIPLEPVTYPGASFTHQGWVTEDHRFLVVGDEEDELFGISDPRNPDLPDTSRTYFFDIQKLDEPEFMGYFDSPAAAIDHNLFVKGNLVYQANYTAGVRVLDISGLATDVSTVREIAHMDTEPRLPTRNMNHNINIFIGPWGVYPYFDSGTIAASDGINGLILMKLDPEP